MITKTAWSIIAPTPQLIDVMERQSAFTVAEVANTLRNQSFAELSNADIKQKNKKEVTYENLSAMQPLCY